MVKVGASLVTPKSNKSLSKHPESFKDHQHSITISYQSSARHRLIVLSTQRKEHNGIVLEVGMLHALGIAIAFTRQSCGMNKLPCVFVTKRVRRFQLHADGLSYIIDYIHENDLNLLFNSFNIN